MRSEERAKSAAITPAINGYFDGRRPGASRPSKIIESNDAENVGDRPGGARSSCHRQGVAGISRLPASRYNPVLFTTLRIEVPKKDSVVCHCRIPTAKVQVSIVYLPIYPDVRMADGTGVCWFKYDHPVSAPQFRCVRKHLSGAIPIVKVLPKIERRKNILPTVVVHKKPNFFDEHATFSVVAIAIDIVTIDVVECPTDFRTASILVPWFVVKFLYGAVDHCFEIVGHTWMVSQQGVVAYVDKAHDFPLPLNP
jgi:hypothetical protein